MWQCNDGCVALYDSVMIDDIIWQFSKDLVTLYGSSVMCSAKFADFDPNYD